MTALDRSDEDRRKAALRKGCGMPAPLIHPNQRDPAEVVPTEDYRPNDPVWFYRDGVWRAAVIEAVSVFAATVVYKSPNSRGTDVDIRTARYVVPRNEIDPLLDADREIFRRAAG